MSGRSSSQRAAGGWPILKIKRVARLRKDREQTLREQWDYIGLEDVESGTGKHAPTKGSSRLSDDGIFGLYTKGDVLYGKLRPYLRKVVIGDRAGACSTEFLVLEPIGVLPEWLQLWLLTKEVTQRIEASCEGAKMPRADWTAIGEIEVTAPPIGEQAKIVGAIANATLRVDTLIDKKARFVELLREKRQALITHAVTKGLVEGVPMNDSGVEWLGKVPAHWEVVRGSVALRESRRKNDGLVSDNYLSLMANRGIVLYADKGDVGNKKPDDLTKCKVVDAGDFVINSMNYQIGSYGVSPYNGVVSPVYVVMKHRPERVAPDFMDLIFANSSYQNYAQSFGTGILDHRRAIGWDVIKVIPIPLPPLKEQRAIAAWAIDRRARVDRLIAKTERSIELLLEHRTALITDAVKGKLDLLEAA